MKYYEAYDERYKTIHQKGLRKKLIGAYYVLGT